MFGFVKPYIPELKVREYELYKSVYCGLCRSMGKHTTVASCASLSFDMTFFALARILLAGDTYSTKRVRCAAHPFRRRPALCDCASLEYTAYVNAFLSYYKLIDDKRDERGVKKMRAVVMMPFARAAVRRIPEEYASVGETIRQRLEVMSSLEAENCDEPSRVADEFGSLIGATLSHGIEGSGGKIAYEIGRYVGRFVYLADAVCDFHDDKKLGRYNPFVAAGAEVSLEKDGFILGHEADGAMAALALVDGDKSIFACMSNIISIGMMTAVKNAENGEKRNEKSI